MKRQKKPLKFYLYVFIFSTVIIGGYSLYEILANETPVSEIYVVWFMPILFTVFYWASDSLILKITNRKSKNPKKKRKNEKSTFLDDISSRMRDSDEFIIEDYRKLKNSKKFQEDLDRAYMIFEQGETDVFTIAKLENKYRKNTVEKRAMKFIVEYLKENPKLPENE